MTTSQETTGKNYNSISSFINNLAIVIVNIMTTDTRSASIYCIFIMNILRKLAARDIYYTKVRDITHLYNMITAINNKDFNLYSQLRSLRSPPNFRKGKLLYMNPLEKEKEVRIKIKQIDILNKLKYEDNVNKLNKQIKKMLNSEKDPFLDLILNKKWDELTQQNNPHQISKQIINDYLQNNNQKNK